MPHQKGTYSSPFGATVMSGSLRNGKNQDKRVLYVSAESKKLSNSGDYTQDGYSDH